MYPRSIIHSGCVLLLIAASSESQRNYTNNDEQRGNSMVWYDYSVSSKNRNERQTTLNNTIKIDEKHLSWKRKTLEEDIVYNAKINTSKIYPSGLIHWCYLFNKKNMSDERNDESTTSVNISGISKYTPRNISTENTKEIFLKNLRYASFLVALLCLLLTFVVYTILSELQSIHGYTLRVHVALLFIVKVIVICIHEFPELKYCILMAYIYNFSAMSSFFWLNVICFDIWWTFRKVRSYRTNVKNREKRKFIMYSIYAWGITFILNVFSVIMNYGLSKTSNDLIQSETCKTNIWFAQKYAMMIYFSIPVGVIVIINICFFILTIQTFLHHDRHIAKDLADLESNRYYKTKRKFGIYLKLFIVMGISWIMEIVSWWFDESKSSIVRNIVYMIAGLQSFIIFMIYVWQKKIMQLLLKRFDWQERNPGKVSNSIDCPNTASNTTSPTSISETVPMQNISLSNQQINHCAESYF